MSKDKNFPFEQLFIRTATGDSTEQFVCMSYKESPPLTQIGDARDTIETTECFYELCGPWGLMMRKYVDEYEEAVADAMMAPDTAGPHLYSARQYLQGFKRLWKAMEHIIRAKKSINDHEVDTSICEYWYTKLKDYPTDGYNKVSRVEKYWKDVYPKLFVIAYYAVSEWDNFQERHTQALNLLSKFVECIYPHFMAEKPDYILDPDDGWPTMPIGEEYRYCDLELSLWHFVGYLDDERQEALKLPDEVFKNLYTDWRPPKRCYQEVLCVYP